MSRFPRQLSHGVDFGIVIVQVLNYYRTVFIISFYIYSKLFHSFLFKVLGDPTRIKILHALSHSELCVCDLAALLSMLDSAVSHQLRVLRAHKLVSNRRQGRNICYTLADNHVRTLFAQGLEHVTEGDQHD